MSHEYEPSLGDVVNISMPTIRFVEPFKKLYLSDGEVCRYAKLILVLVVDRRLLSASFREYDTAPMVCGMEEGGATLLLMFQKFTSRIHPTFETFTTVRTMDDNMHEHYSSKIGKVFDIKVR